MLASWDHLSEGKWKREELRTLLLHMHIHMLFLAQVHMHIHTTAPTGSSWSILLTSIQICKSLTVTGLSPP